MNLAESERDYLRTKQEIELLRAERDRRSKVLKEKHPEMRDLAQKLEKAQTLLAIHRAQSEELNASRIKALELSISNLDTEIASWEDKTIATNQKLAQYTLRKSQLDHSQKLHQDLLLSLHQVDQTRNIAQDTISVMESASPAALVSRNRVKPLITGAFAGLLVGSLLLFALDRLDDRMHSTGDYLANFTAPLLAVVPNQGKAGSQLLAADGDNRHMFVEAYRQLRSSILFKDWDSVTPPKTILITSGIPFEGKSTTAANLAITLALADSRTLLIDADLRRGALKEWFGAGGEIGFSDVVAGSVEVDEVIAVTGYDNLSLIPRGEADIKDFNPVTTRRALDSLRERFDFIIIDSAPLLVVDDTASLAPIVDATLTVMRLNKTPARVGQQTLARLNERQAQVGGVILNCDEPRFSSYKSYGYYRYYESVEVHAKKRNQAPL
jgi:capsular exopolysaccharide synthesis family protein